MYARVMFTVDPGLAIYDAIYDTIQDATETTEIPGMCHILGFYDQFLQRDARSAKHGIAIVSRPSVRLFVRLCRGWIAWE